MRKPRRQDHREEGVTDAPSETSAAPATPVMGRRELNKADKRARILAAGRKLFRSRGFEATTTQAVADEAGIGGATLFSYARSKEDLLIQVFIGDLISVAVRSARKAEKCASVADKVTTLYEGLLRYHYKHPELSQNLISELSSRREEEQHGEVERLMSLLRGSVVDFLLAEWAAPPPIQAADAERLSHNCFAIYYSTLQHGLAVRLRVNDAADELRLRLALQLRPYERLIEAA